MKIFFASAFFSLCLFALCLGTTTGQIFAKYPNPVFVETGTEHGDAIQMALDIGFLDVYSIELSPSLFAKCQERFANNSHVKLFHGDSGSILYDVIKDINQPITFWLDGHYSGGQTSKTEKCTPLLEELAEIQKHPIKTHTILIDDLRCCGTWWFDFITKQQIIDKVMEINPNYIITYDDGRVPNDILVARAP